MCPPWQKLTGQFKNQNKMAQHGHATALYRTSDLKMDGLILWQYKRYVSWGNNGKVPSSCPCSALDRV